MRSSESGADLRIDGVPLERLLTEVLGEPTSVTSAAELAGGQYNRTIGIHLDDHRKVVLRVAPSEAQQFKSEQHLMRNEIAAAPTIRPLAPIPDILGSDLSHRLIDHDLMVQSWLPGTTAAEARAARGETADLAIWRQIGQTLSKFHQCVGSRFGRFIGPAADTWDQHVTNAFDTLRADYLRVGLHPTPINICLDAVHRHSSDLATVQPRLLHGDLGPGNILVASAADPTITGLIDCDRAWWGDPMADWTFYLINSRRPHQQEAFWSGYETAGPLPELPESRSLLYLARSEAEAGLELARLGATDKLRTSQDTLISVTEQLSTT